MPASIPAWAGVVSHITLCTVLHFSAAKHELGEVQAVGTEAVTLQSSPGTQSLLNPGALTSAQEVYLSLGGPGVLTAALAAHEGTQRRICQQKLGTACLLKSELFAHDGLCLTHVTG